MFTRTHLTVEEQLFVLIKESGERGITAKEATEALDGYHGPISGKLSYLHKAGEIFRLVEKRDNFKVYVHPLYVRGRTIERQGRQRNCPHCGEEI